MDIKISKEKCIGCEACLSACPFGAISMSDGIAVISDACTYCGSCVDSCPTEAIELTKDEVIKEDTSAYQGIWIFAEQNEGRLRTVALELLAEAQKLAEELQTDITAVLIGSEVSHLAPQLIAHGADKVLLADEPFLKDFNDEVYTQIMIKAAKQYRPDIILMGATANGRSFAPRVAASLQTGLTADCTVLQVNIETGLLEQTRPAFGGNLMATIICPYHRPQMATVRPKVFKPLPADANKKGQVIRLYPEAPDKLRLRKLSTIKAATEGISLADADIIISAGRGIGSAKNIRLVEELASLLGAAVGSSRPLVDCGWIPYKHQVGQTGKTVGPKLYIACGISGAIQHLAGMSSAETIVAINNDPEAPIFQIAHYALIGDCPEILQELISQIKNLKAQNS